MTAEQEEEYLQRHLQHLKNVRQIRLLFADVSTVRHACVFV